MLAQPVFATTVQQTAQGSLGSVTEESQILPIPGENGKYILKSNGFYCLNEDGTKENTPAVYYFDHFEIDGTVFDGYYYHDESGKFTAGNSHMVQITDLKAPAKDGSGEEVSFDGCYMVNNLGKLSASPQVRYMDELVVDKTTYNGLYYFDEYGKMVTDPGIHYLEMNAAGQMFDGYYYQTASGVFKDGAQAVNGFLAEQKFADTSVQHILSPSSSKDVGLGGRNTTSVKDCAELLSRIYKGECVSKEASEAMLNLLLNQQVTTKIPSGISVSVEIANKTGETDTDQHDIAIVYGEKTTYILCVMSEDCKPGDAVSHIRDISGIVYNYLNMDLDQG